MAVLKIKPEHEDSQGKFVLIDEENFDPSKHELYVENAPEPEPEPEPGTSTKPNKRERK